MKTLQDALGEIPAFDADSKAHVRADAMALADRCPAAGDIRHLAQPVWWPFDRDGIGHHATHMPLERHPHVLAVDVALDEAVEGGKEVLAVIRGVEPEDIRTQHVGEDVLFPWTHTE